MRLSQRRLPFLLIAGAAVGFAPRAESLREYHRLRDEDREEVPRRVIFATQVQRSAAPETPVDFPVSFTTSLDRIPSLSQRQMFYREAILYSR